MHDDSEFGRPWRARSILRLEKPDQPEAIRLDVMFLKTRNAIDSDYSSRGESRQMNSTLFELDYTKVSQCQIQPVIWDSPQYSTVVGLCRTDTKWSN